MDKNQVAMDRFLYDLWTRERNIVFPDTVRNEGIFYRNLARTDQRRDPVQRVGARMVAIPFFFMACMLLWLAIGFLIEHGLLALIPALVVLLPAAGSFAIGAKLAAVAIFPASARQLHPEILVRRRISGRR